MALFIVFVHLKSWFTSTYLYSAASADLDLFGRIKQFSKHKKIAEVGEAVFQRHTWYLTEELIPLSLFDAKLPEDTVNRLAEKIEQLPESNLKIQKPTLPKICRNSAISDFVGPRSTVLFKSIGVKHTFLASPGWRDQPEYQQVKAAVKNQTTTNDCSERALALATAYSGTMTKDEWSFQDLVLIVEAHRKRYKIKKKNQLKKLF